MTPKLVSAEYVRDFVIRLCFEDGREAEVNLEGELWGEVFEPLRDPMVFRAFRLNEDLEHHHLAHRCGSRAGVPVRARGVAVGACIA